MVQPSFWKKNYLLIICASCQFLFAQGQSKIDSIKNVLRLQVDDTNKVNSFSYLGYQFFLQHTYDSSRKYHEDALNLARSVQVGNEKGWRKGEAAALQEVGLTYYEQDNFNEALKYYYEALKIFEEIDDKNQIAGIYINLGLLYEGQNNNDSAALKSYLDALNIYESTRNSKALPGALQQLANVYLHLNDTSNAMKYFQKQLDYYSAIGDKQGIARYYFNIGNVYSHSNADIALNNFRNALKIQEEIGDKRNMESSYFNIASIYASKEDFQEALKNYGECLKLQEERGSKYWAALTYGAIGGLYIKIKEFDKAVQYLQEQLLIGKEFNDKYIIQAACLNLVDVFVKTNDYKKAYEYQILFSQVKDSIENAHNNEQTAQRVAIHENEKRDALEADRLNREKLLRNGFGGGFALMLLFAVIFFTQRKRILKAKKRSDELLLNILPEETAEELKTKGSVEAKSFDEVTVMFTDFKNFTQASEKMNAKELVSEIHFLFSEFDKIISKHNIEKIKTIGDSYMCAGGLPVANKTNASDVLNTASEIQHFMNQLKEQREKENKHSFEIRIGIHTGPVVAGIVGIKKFAYDIWGDTVNIASRMESSGEAGKINISGSTYQLIKDKFVCTPRGKIPAKNKGEVEMYFVEGIL